MKLTAAQMGCLLKLAEQPLEPFSGWCNYGAGSGVKRNVARALSAKGLAEVDENMRPGVSARITPAGREYLATKDTNHDR